MARPAFRKPWTHGAKAYAEADSFEAILGACSRRRVVFTVIVNHADTDMLKGVPCVCCGDDLTGPSPDRAEPDTYSLVDVNPVSRSIAPKHYYCAWGSTMSNVMKLRELVA